MHFLPTHWSWPAATAALSGRSIEPLAARLCLLSTTMRRTGNFSEPLSHLDLPPKALLIKACTIRRRVELLQTHRCRFPPEADIR
eukprot:1679417-Pleurochrysis_carterae.AAC.1